MSRNGFPVGGKALGLERLRSCGLAVPPYSLWQEDVFGPALRGLAASGTPWEKAAHLRRTIRETPWEPRAATAVLRIFRELTEDGRLALAVRSSASDEDGLDGSLAGQMDTFLNLRSAAAVMSAVRACQASVFSERAVSTRSLLGLDWTRARLTVILQRQLDAEVSGVLFTRDWGEGGNGGMLVCSLWGLGEGLVSGALDADCFRLDQEGRIKELRLAVKPEKVGALPGGGTGRAAVQRELQNAPSLTEAQLRELHAAGALLRRRIGRELDIEFALTGGRVCYLQCRPIAGLHAGAEPPRIWDNSNITESYPGLTSPLTFTFIRQAYAAVYRQFCRVLGVPARVIRENEDVFPHMLGHLKGRVYYNLMSWYRVVSFLPGFGFNKGFLEEMMGLAKIREFVPRRRAAGVFKRYLVELPSLASVGLRMAAAFLFLERRARRFFRDFSRTYAGLRDVDWDSRSLEELMQARAFLEREVLARWKTPILNDLKCMVFFGLLRRLCSLWIEDASLANDLAAGEPGMHSKQAVDSLCALARMARGQEGLRRLLLDTDPEEAWSAVQDQEAFSSFRAAVQGYLRDFGVRGVEEMKLESPTLRDRPAFLMGMIRNAAENLPPDGPGSGEARSAGRREAEQRARRKLRGARRLAFSFVLSMARQAVRTRENQRFCRAQIYSVVRELFRSCGRRLAAAGLLRDPADVFYLEMDEVASAFDGTATTDRFSDLARLRSSAFMEYRSVRLPDNLETRGPPCVSLNGLAAAGRGEQAQKALKGTGAGPGVFEGRVRVLERPEAGTRLKGEVLVASYTDPGWSLVFPGIGALIVEHGSLLSHSAIIAREMGIPAVVGVAGATRTLRDGDRVRVDGHDGTVTLLGRAAP